MPRRVLAALAALLLPVIACGGNSTPPPSNGGSSGTGGTVTGTERLAWTQSAESPDDLAVYQYALYVDNQRRVIEGATCTPGAGISVDCFAPLPTLTAGRHTLQLAAFFMAGDTVIEGERSPVVDVTVASVTAPAGGQFVRGGTFVSSDGLRLQASVLGRDLLDPVDLAVAPDGRAFVAERSGRLRIIAADSAGFHDDNLLEMIGETPAGDGHGVRSIALSPDFTESGTLFVAYVGADRDQPVLRIVRFRETAGLIGQPAHIASHAVSADDVAAIVRFGPDTMLHVGIGSGSNDRDAQNVSAASGKVLRLRPDGMTPEDNPSASPVLSTGHSDPRGLAWLATDQSLWEIEPAEAGDEVNRIRSGGNYGWTGIQRSSNDAAPATPPVLVLPRDSQASGLTIVNAKQDPLFGDLIVSTLGARDLLRFRFDSTGQPRLIGRMLDARYGRIAQVVSGHDGSLYLITANRDEWGAGNDVLIRLRTLQRVPSRIVQ